MRSFGNISQYLNIHLNHQTGVLQATLKTVEWFRLNVEFIYTFQRMAWLYCQLSCCGFSDLVALYLISRSDTPSSHWYGYAMWVPRDARNGLWLVEKTCWSCTCADQSYLQIPGTNSTAKWWSPGKLLAACSALNIFCSPRIHSAYFCTK